MKIFTLSAACNVLRDSLLNINLLFEAFCIFKMSFKSVFQNLLQSKSLEEHLKAQASIHAFSHYRSFTFP